MLRASRLTPHPTAFPPTAMLLFPHLWGISFLICFVRQAQSAVIVYPISEVFCHQYLKKLWFSISVCASAAALCAGQERGDQAEVRGKDVPHICKPEGGEGMTCWTNRLQISSPNMPQVCFLLLSVCYIFLHAVLFLTCRMKRSS